MEKKPVQPSVRSTRLGDLLVSRRKLQPHQLNVALSVQRKARVPLGRILVETRILSRFDLWLTLVRQWLLRRFRSGGQKAGAYGADLLAWGRQLLERHLCNVKDRRASGLSSAEQETQRLRAELAHLTPEETARMVEKDDDLKERMMSGNF